jgi:hypothetical protein
MAKVLIVCYNVCSIGCMYKVNCESTGGGSWFVNCEPESN